MLHHQVVELDNLRVHLVSQVRELVCQGLHFEFADPLAFHEVDSLVVPLGVVREHVLVSAYAGALFYLYVWVALVHLVEANSYVA